MNNLADRNVAKTASIMVILVLMGLLLLIIILNGTSNYIEIQKLKDKTEYLEDITVRLENPEFLRQSPKEGLWDALIYYEIPHPEIVYAQAVQETGNFTSSHCHEKNNLFGLYNNSKRRYMHFDHWVNSVETYKKCFSDKYVDTTENYYTFLLRMKYAQDSNYISKIKTIVESNSYGKK